MTRETAEDPLTAENNLTKQTQQNNISRAERNAISRGILNANEMTVLPWNFRKAPNQRL